MNKPLEYFKSNLGKDSSQSPSPLMQWLNPTLISADAGELEFSYKVRKEMTNPIGIIHGGTTAAIIDDAIGAAVFSLGVTHVYTTVSLSVDYFSRAKAGDTIISKTKIIKKGQQIINAECEVWNADKTRMIAKGHSNLIKTKIEI
ncbi:PaaI family thioesterase [Maribacter sp. TH_r10]|uniref:Hotdog fold thioesterase n=1 Tax=Maribacter luteus TaxID=2594478 RepID=A0A6I2MRS6_9FLAO|nr:MULTISPECIES: PaaI family thioesterase [Maribacter]MDV7139370.1 PaaI family thioesterase [Maribacter sp. TH_r10]MRX65539.1 hotdog fold thioesterase [Maribacter luteus]|tara:strand:+ start:50 stop:484 length:435 start_codon:yes stop_codon:yes gene_type:complete